MSTKIYTAYRIRSKDFWKWVTSSGVPGKTSVAKALMPKFEAYMGKLDPDLSTRQRTFSTVSDHFRTEFGNQLGSLLRNEHDFTVEISAYYYRNWVYLIPSRGDAVPDSAFKYLKADPKLEEFGYWNNVDGPDDISEQDWAARGKVWDKVLTRPTPSVIIPILGKETWYEVMRLLWAELRSKPCP